MGKHCDSGLDDRCRDNDGEIRHKRSTRASARFARRTEMILRLIFEVTRNSEPCSTMPAWIH